MEPIPPRDPWAIRRDGDKHGATQRERNDDHSGHEDGNIDASGSFISYSGGMIRNMMLYQSGTSVTGTYTVSGDTYEFTDGVVTGL